ncbi:non-ribosomal peptide synthetase [Mycobacterium camsae]|uniref:hypothetical protein n=1 Tax=Mycobacterium gordonae TaxID=1778 RepID=UPI0019815131|nr:hypothetical protein [Mycobacterium gordonae]
MSDVLDLYDQTQFLGQQATGATNLLQCFWLYHRDVDVDGLRRFHRQLSRGPLARNVERSPLPFGRHRWVAPRRDCELAISETPRPRAQFESWLAEQANVALDAEHGPGWQLAMLPFAEGGAGLSLVVTHCLTDGVGLCTALADAACGRPSPIRWAAAGSRSRWQALRQDAGQALRDLPAIGRAVVVAARAARRQQDSAAPAPGYATDERVTLPTVTLFVDAEQWDARAVALGGTSNTLLAGFAAGLAQRVGRLATDGTVALTVPVNERTADDTRANAITNVDLAVDPRPTTTDLRPLRGAIKHALIRSATSTNERWKLLPLAPLLPHWLVRRWVGLSASGAASVIASNLGALDTDAMCPDGTEADYFAMKSLAPGATSAIMNRLGGLLTVLSGRTRQHVFVSVLAYQQGRSNSTTELRQHLSDVLSDFMLTADELSQLATKEASRP